MKAALLFLLSFLHYADFSPLFSERGELLTVKEVLPIAKLCSCPRPPITNTRIRNDPFVVHVETYGSPK